MLYTQSRALALREEWTTTLFDDQAPAMRTTITLPKGTRVKVVDEPMGLAYAVDDVPLLVKLTGNNHDPQYRHVFVPGSKVDLY